MVSNIFVILTIFNPYLGKWSNLTNIVQRVETTNPVIYVFIYLSNFMVYFTHIGFNCFALNLTSQQFFNELPDIVPQRWLTYIRNFTLIGFTVKSKLMCRDMPKPCKSGRYIHFFQTLSTVNQCLAEPKWWYAIYLPSIWRTLTSPCYGNPFSFNTQDPSGTPSSRACVWTLQL